MTEVVDLLAALREGTRRGAGREVDTSDPAPSTRGTGETTDLDGQTQIEPSRISYEAAIRERLAAGRHTPTDVRWARERCRTPNLRTRVGDGTLRVGCTGCVYDKPVVFLGVEIASSPCELDGVCWRAERDAEVEAGRDLPLWRLRKTDGRPNYRSASEQELFMREAGWLEWSTGAKGGPDPGKAKTSGRRTKKVEWPLSWETWVERQQDPARIPPSTADRSLLAPWQRELLDGEFDELPPIEKLASPWRRWEGEHPDPEPCLVCGERGGWSVAGRRYCRIHAAEAQTAQAHGLPLPSEALEVNDDKEVAAA